jgi:hypothetical protein
MICAYFTHQIQRMNKNCYTLNKIQHIRRSRPAKECSHNNVCLSRMFPCLKLCITPHVKTLWPFPQSNKVFPQSKMCQSVNQQQKDCKYTFWSHDHYSIFNSCYNLQQSWQRRTLSWPSSIPALELSTHTAQLYNHTKVIQKAIKQRNSTDMVSIMSLLIKTFRHIPILFLHRHTKNF